METSKVVNVDRQIDCIGLFCPMPIVKTREAIREMTVGQVLEMHSELIGVSREGAVYRFLVRKTR